MAENVAASGPQSNGVVEFASATSRSRLSRQVAAGRSMRLAAGIYVTGSIRPPADLAYAHRFAIIAALWPGAVITGKSAFSGAEPVDGEMFICHPQPTRRSAVRLPGLTLHPHRGPGPLPDDMPLPNGLWLAGVARGLVENTVLPGRAAQSRAGNRDVENRIDSLAQTAGSGRVRAILNQLPTIAPHYDPALVARVRNTLVAVLGTVTAQTDHTVTSARLAARIAGTPFDEKRLELLESVVATLERWAPQPRLAAATTDPAKASTFAFFEAYFSNYIEGTQFSVAEARSITFDGLTPINRPKDAHDIAATYRLASDHLQCKQAATSAAEFTATLQQWHSILMKDRPELMPGVWKAVDNYAGGYHFVAPELVVGTLREGFQMMGRLADPFTRAVAAMFLVTECHPFLDGNGRISRLYANAELSAAGQVRIIIPTVYRNNYLAALHGTSNRWGAGESLIAVLDFAQKWSAAIPWDSFDSAHAAMELTHAYTDSGLAEATGQRLRLP